MGCCVNFENKTGCLIAIFCFRVFTFLQSHNASLSYNTSLLLLLRCHTEPCVPQDKLRCQSILRCHTEPFVPQDKLRCHTERSRSVNSVELAPAQRSLLRSLLR